MPAGFHDYGVAILGGGEATRLPGKLMLETGSLPMIVRVYRNVASREREVFISCKATFPLEIDALLPCPMVVDRWPSRGPLAALLSTLGQMRSAYIFAVAADAPFIDGRFIDMLAGYLEPGDEAVVPRHGGRLEPLAAFYDREAFIAAGLPLLLAGNGALTTVIDALATRYVDIGDDRVFANVNTPADYAAIREVLT